MGRFRRAQCRVHLFQSHPLRLKARLGHWIAATTGARKGEVLPRKWTEGDLDGSAPHIYVPGSKNGRPKRLSLADEAVSALRALPSFEEDEYVFPADRGDVRFTGKQLHIWDIRNPSKRPETAPASVISAFTTSGTWLP